MKITSKNTFPLIRATDGTEQILFGDLFKLNEKISNKCVGLLQRARKYRFAVNLGSSETNSDVKMHCRLLHFTGETLWQGADDKVVISLLRRNRFSKRYILLDPRMICEFSGKSKFTLLTLKGCCLTIQLEIYGLMLIQARESTLTG